MNRQQMEELAERLNQEEHVHNARVVEFLGRPHIHVDLESDDIEVITENGESRITPIHTSTRRQ